MSRLSLSLALLAAVAFTAPAEAASFLFIRHAESTTNAGTANPEDIVDPPLTALGEQQALDLADTLAGVDLTTIYVSSYKRTALTIAPTAADHGLTPIVEPDIREWSFGTGALDYGKISAMFGEWLSGNTAARIEGVPDSESLDDLVARVLPAYLAIIGAHADEDGTVALVGHGGSIAWVLPFLVENLSLDYAVANGLKNTGIVEVESYQGKLYVTNWQGTAMDWPGQVTQVPLPASGLLLAGAAGSLVLRARRGKKAAA